MTLICNRSCKQIVYIRQRKRGIIVPWLFETNGERVKYIRPHVPITITYVFPPENTDPHTSKCDLSAIGQRERQQ